MSDETKDLSDLLPHIVLDVPSCPVTVINQQIIETIRDFCHVTQGWLYKLDAKRLVEDRTDYSIESDFDWAVIDGVASVFYRATYSARDDDYTLLTPGRDYTLIDKTTLRLATAPGADAVKGLVIVVYLKPSLAATKIDAQLYDNHYNAWVHGVKARLMMMPAAAWRNPALAQYHANEYGLLLARARIELEKGGPGVNAEARVTSGGYTFL